MTDVEPIGPPSGVHEVFEPHSAALPPLRRYLGDLWDRRDFLRALAVSDVKGSHANTTLGHLWGILDPLFLAGIYFFLFSVIRGGSNTDHLPLLISGIFLFSLTSAAMGTAAQSIQRSKSLMLNSTFPRALLPLSALWAELLKFRLTVFIMAFALLTLGDPFGPGLFVVPLLFVLHNVLNVGIALGVATFTTLVPDGRNLMTYVSRLTFFSTPIIYPADLLPAAAQKILLLQPVYGVFASYQAIFSGDLPPAGAMASAVFWTVLVFVLGARTFLRHERQFALHIN